MGLLGLVVNKECSYAIFQQFFHLTRIRSFSQNGNLSLKINWYLNLFILKYTISIQYLKYCMYNNINIQYIRYIVTILICQWQRATYTRAITTILGNILV